MWRQRLSSYRVRQEEDGTNKNFIPSGCNRKIFERILSKYFFLALPRSFARNKKCLWGRVCVRVWVCVGVGVNIYVRKLEKNSTTENGKDKKAFSGANAIPHTQILSMLRL